MNNNEQTLVWTKIITSKNKLFKLDLIEVWLYRDLIWIFVRRDLVSIYKQTILGPIWFLFGPLFTVFTYTFAFSTIAKIPTDGIPPAIFYLSGTTMWNYFQACLNGTSSTFSSNSSIFGKVYFPRLVPAISLIISNLVKLGIQFVVFLCFCFFYFNKGSIQPNVFCLLFPFLVILLGGIALGLGLFISSLTTKYRDLNQLIGVFMMLLMYASPIIYPSSQIPMALKRYLIFNPISPIIDAFRYGFTGAGTIDIYGLIYSTLFASFCLFIGVVFFNKIEKTFIDTV